MEAGEVKELAAEAMPDDELLAVCDTTLSEPEQSELSDLLERNSEGPLTETDTARLDELMLVYRRGVVRKANALKVAVERGLRLPVT